VLKALESNGYFQTLAEPNLIAYNGQEASFLAGGEFPIPVVQGATGTVTVIFKEFGVKLNFTPRIAGDTIRLKVRPEVSSLDFNNGITLSGFRIPALVNAPRRNRRRAARWSVVRNRRLAETTSRRTTAPRVPILSKLPIIGALFRAKSDRSEQTELMVLVTPRLVRPLDPDESTRPADAPGSVPATAWRSGESGSEQGLEGPVVAGPDRHEEHPAEVTTKSP